MSRKTTAAKAIFVATALGASALGMSPALAAGETVTSVGPAVVATNQAATIVIKGTNFGSNVETVQFGTCTAVTPIVVDATTMYATKAAACATAGKQTVTLDLTTGSNVVFNPTDAKKTVTFVAPVAGTVNFNGKTTGVAGSPLNVTGLTGLAATGVSATLGGKPVASFKLKTGGFTGKVPAGVVPGAADLVVRSGGVDSAAFTGFTVKQAIKVTPASAPVGTPGEITITGAGLKPASPATVAVTVCGVAATPVAPTVKKPYTDGRLTVTVPGATSTLGLTAADGGACNVVVTTDINGSATDAEGQVNLVSVRTAGSTFTYAAH